MNEQQQSVAFAIDVGDAIGAAARANRCFCTQTFKVPLLMQNVRLRLSNFKRTVLQPSPVSRESLGNVTPADVYFGHNTKCQLRAAS
jgi:hypothetical protein